MAVGLALVASIAAGCGSQNLSATAVPTPVQASSCAARLGVTHRLPNQGPAWIVRPGSLQKMERSGLPKSVLEDFNRPTTLLLVHSGNRAQVAPLATLTWDFTSAAALDSALSRHQIPADVPFVLLDLERWTLTPTSEQRQPIVALRAAVRRANAAGKCVVFTPAVDLVGGLTDGNESDQIARFDDVIVAPGAALSDAFDIQSQGTEGTGFASVLTPDVVASVRAVRPTEPLFVGLSTNPNGRHVTVADLVQLYRTGESLGATGYWLNVPESDPECPACGKPQVRLGVAFLEALAKAGWKG
jgi:hypothetical protein